MDLRFTDIDNLIENLQKRVIGSGSPPVVENGVLGLWRTVRGFRTFLELNEGTGKWAVQDNGKSYVQGRVLVGPPSLVNRPIADVPNEVWNKLSGSGTKATFPSANPEGIKALKTSIRNSLKDDDTRLPVLAETTDLVKLISLARSAGFLDEDIQAALGGKVFRSGLEDNVVSLADHKKKKPPAPETDESPDVPVAAGAENTPFPTSTSNPAPPSGQMTADGSVAMLIDALKIPGIHNADKKRKSAERLLAAAGEIKDEFLRKQIRALAHGLMTNDYKVEEVKEEIRALIQHRKARLLAQVSSEEMDRLADKAAAKDAVRKIKQHIESHPDPTPAQAAQSAEYLVKVLTQLARQLGNPAVSKEVVQLAGQVRSRKVSGKSLLMKILLILRLILAFVPGLG